jgi:hypothetical protein
MDHTKEPEAPAQRPDGSQPRPRTGTTLSLDEIVAQLRLRDRPPQYVATAPNAIAW